MFCSNFFQMLRHKPLHFLKARSLKLAVLASCQLIRSSNHIQKVSPKNHLPRSSGVKFWEIRVAKRCLSEIIYILEKNIPVNILFRKKMSASGTDVSTKFNTCIYNCPISLLSSKRRCDNFHLAPVDDETGEVLSAFRGILEL